MSRDSWNEDFKTRPIGSMSSYAIPACELTVGEGSEPLRFASNRVTLGSDRSNDVVLNCDTVSRFHAEIVRTAEGCLLKDLGSTNGTYLDSVKVQSAFLRNGSIIELGGAKIAFGDGEKLIQPRLSEKTSLGALVGRSAAMRRIFHLIEQISPTDATVLLLGETGTGKEVVAKTIHSLSRRSRKPFIVIDLAAIPGGVLESELFGHERGSFTGAISGRIGLFEQADGGTVFLDEIGEIPLELQSRLLRVLETGEVRRVGSNKTVALDVRVIAATNRDLALLVQGGRFRSDLYYRLNVVPILLPPLRQRKEDIEPLAASILATARFNQLPGEGKRVESLGGTALESLMALPFPGNVRELVNILEREVSLSDGRVLRHLSNLEAFVPPADRPPGAEKLNCGDQVKGGVSLCGQRTSAADNWGNLPEKFREAKEQLLRDFEARYLDDLMSRCDDNLSLASRLSGIDRKHLRYLLSRRKNDNGRVS